MSTIRYDSLPIVIDGKVVYYKTVKHTEASEIVFATSGKNPMVWLKVEGAKPQSMNVGTGEHEITIVLGRGPGKPLPREMLKIQTWNSAI